MLSRLLEGCIHPLQEHMYGSVAPETCHELALINRDDAPVAMFASLAKPLEQGKGSWTHIDE